MAERESCAHRRLSLIVVVRIGSRFFAEQQINSISILMSRGQKPLKPSPGTCVNAEFAGDGEFSRFLICVPL